MNKVNSLKLKELIQERGEYGLASLSIESRVSISTIEKLMAGTYPNVPKLALRRRLCDVLKVPMEVLFPLVSAKGKRAS